MKRVVFILAMSLVATRAGAEPKSLAGVDIDALVRGSILEVDTPMSTTLPVHYKANGLLYGEAGNLEFYLGSAKDRGRWWVENDKLCHKWFRWFDAEKQCLKLARDGDAIHWLRDDGTTGTAKIKVQPRTEIAEAAQPAPAAKAVSKPEAPPAPVVEASLIPNLAGSLSLTTTANAAPAAEKHVEQPKVVTAPDTAIASEASKPKPAIAATKPAPAKATASASQADSKKKAAREAPKPVAKAASKAAPTNGQLAKAEPTSPEKPTPLPEPSYKVAGVDTDDVLNVRGGPAEDYAAIGAIRPGEAGVRIVGACREDWCPIRHRNIGGWVNRYYLAEEHTDGWMFKRR